MPKGRFKTYYEAQNMVAISDVDTRALVRHIRDKGAMNGIVSSEITDIKRVKNTICLKFLLWKDFNFVLKYPLKSLTFWR